MTTDANSGRSPEEAMSMDEAMRFLEARGQVHAARHAVRLIEDGLREQIAQLESDLSAARAERDEIESALGYIAARGDLGRLVRAELAQAKACGEALEKLEAWLRQNEMHYDAGGSVDGSVLSWNLGRKGRDMHDMRCWSGSGNTLADAILEALRKASA